MEEFSCVYIPLTAMRMYVCMAMEKRLDGMIAYLTDLQMETRKRTAWHGRPDKERYVCALLPNFFILYFGQNPPTGDITTDDVKMEFATLGKGYEAWCAGAEEAIQSKQIITKVRETSTHWAWTKSHGSSTTVIKAGQGQR